ncbi:hypothetical protein OROGR_008756 [Orobanche gracilis]
MRGLESQLLKTLGRRWIWVEAAGSSSSKWKKRPTFNLNYKMLLVSFVITAALFISSRTLFSHSLLPFPEIPDLSSTRHAPTPSEKSSSGTPWACLVNEIGPDNRSSSGTPLDTIPLGPVLNARYGSLPSPSDKNNREGNEQHNTSSPFVFSARGDELSAEKRINRIFTSSS